MFSQDRISEFYKRDKQILKSNHLYYLLIEPKIIYNYKYIQFYNFPTEIKIFIKIALLTFLMSIEEILKYSK